MWRSISGPLLDRIDLHVGVPVGGIRSPCGAKRQPESSQPM
ncbi:MAG: hypothetical protein ACLTG0_08800 [Oscillibacter sp.]